ncbi:MAG: right-handed parallel beta-helix repeat-containing protein [Candidatus Bathyarchaeota archaeon]|nr:MAG: right-handed parallel beta-helix repeat-containing protein [Candidatus Bathyarchaeota archaeon]
MNRKLGFFVFLVGLYVVSLFVGAETKSALVENDILSASSDGGLNVYFFTGKGCPHCARVEPLIAEIEQRYPIHLHTFDIYTNRSSIPLFDEYSSSHGITLGEKGIPAIFISDTYLVGDSPILNGFEDAVKESLKESSPSNQDLEVKDSEYPDQKVASVVSNLPIVTLTVAALVDAINPCSIALLVFLIGARILVSNQRRRALKVGLSFCLSVFIAYFLFGLGLLTVVQVSGFSGIFSLLVGLVALVSGIFYLKDVFWHGRGGFVMEVPRSLKPLLMKMLKGVTNPFGAFVMGFVVCLFEVPCTGGPYLFILGLMADSATKIQAIPLLLYYNFIFVLPLSIICLLLYSNLFSIHRIREWNEKNKRLLRLAGGFTMIALGFLTIPVSSMIQLIQLSLLCFKVAGPPVLVIVFFYLVALFAKGKNLGPEFTRLLKGAALLCLLATTVFVVQTPVMDVSAGEDELPVADAGPDQTVLLGESVTFDGSGSYDLDGIIISYEWDFGDPLDSTIGTGVNPTRTYSHSSVYVVTLTVTDDAGWESSDTMTVVVEDKILMLELNYDMGSLSLLDVYKKSGFAPDRRIQPESGHTAQIVSKSEKILYEFTFGVPNVWQYDYADGDVLAGGSVELDETDFTLVIPYFESAAWINLYYPDGSPALSVHLEGIPDMGGSNCQTMVNNGLSSLLLDIVFVADNYTTAQLSQFSADVNTHQSTLLSVPPFSNHSGSINIHWVNESRSLSCQYGAPPYQRLITCNDNAVINLATQCPADEVIVLLNSNKFGGSGIRSPPGLSSYAVAYSGVDNTTTPPITDWSGDRVTVHEFGHSFGNLLDEYNGTSTSTSTPNGPNCDSQPCTRWAPLNLSTTCNQGCTYSNWYRGDNGQGDLMKTVKRLHFGPVCRYSLNANLSSYPRPFCNSTIPCQAGDVLVQSRTLNSSDFNTGPCPGIGLEIGAPNITLDCNGIPITGNMTGSGIISLFNNVTIKNCNVSRFTNGIHVLGAQNNTVFNNTVSTTPLFPRQGSGIWVQYSASNNVTSNTASSFKWGIALDTNSNNNLIDNNTVSSCQYGIELYSSSGNTLEETKANNNTDHGIYLRSSSSNNRIINSTADFNLQHGLFLSDLTSTGNNVTNSRFCFNNQTGLGYYDICDADANNGTNNRCGTTSNWTDTGAATGCTFSCRTNTTTYTNSSIGAIVLVGSTWAATPITVLISNVTSSAFISNATAAVAMNRTIGLFANVSLKCPPIDWAYIQLDYNESGLVFDESTLRMYTWDYAISNWTLIPNSGVNTSANFVWANVTHLSIFTGISELPVCAGNLEVRAEIHDVGVWPPRGSAKEPLIDLAVNVYDKSSGSCAASYGISWQNYPDIVVNCQPIAVGSTDNSGIVTFSLQAGDYLVIGNYGSDKHLGVSASNLACNQTMKKYLQLKRAKCIADVRMYR